MQTASSSSWDSYRPSPWAMCGHLRRWGDLPEGRSLISNCLTWAKRDVAELGLLLRALTGVPTKLRGFACAGPIPVSSPTCGRAQAPWRPLIPGAVHCNQSRRNEFSFPKEAWRSAWVRTEHHLSTQNKQRGKAKGKPTQNVQEEHCVIFYALALTQSVTFWTTWNKT